MNSNEFKCCGGTVIPDSEISVYDWAIKNNKDIIPKNKLPEFYSKDEVDQLIRNIERDGVEIINGDWYINGQYAGRATGQQGEKGDAGNTPYIQNDYWYINGTNTLIKAVGQQGPQGKAFTYEDFTEEQLLALKGDPGKDGKDGKSGTDGKDGNQTEYIYALSNSETAPSRPSSLNVDNYCPIGWNTVPQQISEQYKFQYISSRKKINGIWGDFSTPVLFSRYAEKGAVGGHYEFRYKNSEERPTKPVGNGLGNGWTSEPSTPTDGKFTWMSQSLFQDNKYGEWSNPTRITGDNGKDGEDGKSFEFIYINYTPGDNGAYPSISYDTYIDDNGIEQNPDNDDFVPRGWTDNPTGVSEKNQYEWFSTREKVKGIWSQFSFPVIWSKWGERGQDGDGYEYIYLLSNIEPDNPTPYDYETNNNYQNLDEYVSLLSGWTDEPQGVNEDYQIEWVSMRRRKGNKWQPFSKPAEWARWSSKGTDGGHWVFAYTVSKVTPLLLPDGSDLRGWTYTMPENVDRESGLGIYMTQCFVSGSGAYGTWSTPIRISGEDGRPGTDGNFTEFVYTKTAKDSTAIRNNLILQLEQQTNSSGIDRNEDDFVPDGWFDNPQGVDDQNQYEWVSTRTRKGANTWEDFSVPSIWSKWGEKGMDGDGYEYVFFVTPEQVVPELNSDDRYNGKTKEDDEYLPYASQPTIRWTDDPQDVSEVNQYEWVSVRKKRKGVWGEFEDPKIWTRWAPKGGHYEFRYKNSSTQPSPPTGDGTTYGWNKQQISPDIKSGIYTWMSQCYIEKDTYDGITWSPPIRITGEDGVDGTDGKEIEFIYTLTKTNDSFNAPTIDDDETIALDDWPNVDGDTPSKTINGIIWNDNPKGVTDQWMYEWVCTRTKRDGVWSTYSPPAVWSKWGEKGMDGDGYEYIYKQAEEIETTPTISYDDYNSKTKQDDDFIPEGWTDDPSGISEEIPFEWVSKRKKTNGVWGNFSEPVIWSRWAYDGINGGHWVFAYKNSATQPPTPEGQKTLSELDGWSESVQSPDVKNGIFTWMTQNFVTDGNNYGDWSEPIRITGDNGIDGTDGTQFEYIYTKTKTNDRPSIDYDAYNGKTKQDDDFVPEGWSDNPQGVDEEYQYEWVAVRKKTNKGTWSDFGTAVVWSKWGEKGMDGDSFEYIYHLSNKSNPENITNPTPSDWEDEESIYQNVEEYVDKLSAWSDDPPSPNQQNQFVYVCKRTRKYDSDKKKSLWTRFSDPSLWAKWSERGESGGHYEFRYKNATQAPTKPGNGTNGSSDNWTNVPSTPDVDNGEYTWMTQCYVLPSNSKGDVYGEWTNPIRITGSKGEHGADGTDIEFIYTRNNTGQAPAAPTGKNNEDDWSGIVDGITWTDNPQGVTMDIMYEYVSMRTKKSGESWSNYSTPVIWSKWGEKGMDGDGYEYVYKLSETAWESTVNPSPTNWETNTEYQKDDYKPSGWSDDPESISADMPYQYVCVRKKKNGIWQKFSDAKLWLHWSEGIPGSSPYFADIDNEMDSVACDQNGYTIAEYETNIYVHVWHGSTEEALTTLTNNNTITNFTITPFKNEKRIYVRIGRGKYIDQVNKINITAASANSGNKSLHFVLNGVRAGANGDPAVIYSLVPSVSNVIKKKDGSYSVSQISCTRQKNVGGIITNNTIDGTISYKLDNRSEQSYSNNGTISVTQFSKSIQFIFRVNGIIVDVENIPMISDGADGTNGTNGTDGLPGNDAYTVKIEPANIIFNQSTTKNSSGKYPLEPSSQTATIVVKKGNSDSNVSHTVSIQSISGCSASNSGDNITVTGVLGDNTEGSVIVRVKITNGPTFDSKLNVYYNLLGSWKESVEGGVETITAEKISYVINNGDTTKRLSQSKDAFNSVRSASGAFETWKNNTSTGYAHDIESINNKINTATESVSAISNKVDGIETANSEIRQTADSIKMSVGAGIGNLLSDTDFIDNNHLGAWDTKAGSVNTGNKYNGYNSYYKYSSNSYDDVLRQILFSNDIRRIQPNTVYTLSFYAKGVGTLITYVYPTCIDTEKVIVDGTEKEYWAVDGACEWSLNYSNYVKHTFTFKTTSSFNSDTKYLLFRLKSSSQYVYISQPRLDVGYSARDYTEGLTRAGINIGNGTVNLYGDKVIFSDREGGNTDKIWIDPDDGTLNAKNGVFSGTVNATRGNITGNLDVTGGFNVKSGTTTVVTINASTNSTGSSNGNITILDANGLYIKRGNEGFRLTTNGFQRWNSSANNSNGGWVNFYGGRYVRTVTSFTYMISLDDDFIIAKPSSSDKSMYLPSTNIPDGKIISVINAGTYGIHINGNGKTIKGSTTYTKVTLNIGDRMEFIYVDPIWYVNYMPIVDY